MDIAYGIEVQPKDDPYIKAAELALAAVARAAMPGAFLVDALPFLKHVPAWVPGAKFQEKAREWRKLADQVVETPYAAMKKAMVCCRTFSSRKAVTHRTMNSLMVLLDLHSGLVPFKILTPVGMLRFRSS